MIFIGIGSGILISFAAARLLAGFLFGVGAVDAVAFAGLPLMLGLVAIAACYFPASRASRADPLASLRFD